MNERWSVEVERMILIATFSGLAFYILNQVLRYSGWGWPGFLATIFWIIFVFVLALSQPFYFWGKEKISDSVWAERLQIVGYLAIHYVSDIMTLIMIRDIVGFPMWAGSYWNFWSWDGWNLYTSQVSAGLLGAPFVLLLAGHLVIRWGPFVKHVTIEDPRLPTEFDGFKIAHLSDIHLGPMMSPSLVDKLFRKVMDCEFNAIVMTGDIVDCDPDRYPDDVKDLNRLSAPDGVFYCPGNHEYYWGLEKAIRPVRAAGIHILMNQFSEIQKGSGTLRIWGAPDPVSKSFPNVPAPDWEKMRAKGDGAFEVLLAHQPHLADRAKERGFHLQLSGHTHAGQFFPWNLLVGLFQKYTKGLYRLRSSGQQIMNLYVNQGTGFWGPPTRLGTYGEITLFTLRRSARPF